MGHLSDWFAHFIGPTDADEHDGYTQRQQGAALPEQRTLIAAMASS